MVSRRQPVVDSLFFATVFTVTFAKIHWSFGSDLSLSDVLTVLFLIAFALGRIERLDGRFPRSSAITFGFFLAFLAVYLLGFFNLDTATALSQWGKGMVKFVLHFLFLFAAVALVARRSQRFYWWALAAFCGGIVVNALYGVLQLGVAQATGGNLDAALLAPLTGGASQINIYGAIGGANVYRPNALTGDPNHLAIELVIPLLVLLPIYLRLERGHRLRVPLMATLMFLLVMELATLSRSGMLGLLCGLAVLAVPYRHLLLSERFPAAARGRPRRHSRLRRPARRLLPDGAQVARRHERRRLVDAFRRLRVHPAGALAASAARARAQQLLGLLRVRDGRDNFGPHSFYVALFVETGIVGALLFLAFLGYLFQRLALGRAIGRSLADAGDALAARVRPLEWGLTAALVATMAANLFYLTMSFYYFFVFAMLAIVAPAVFGRRPTAT